MRFHAKFERRVGKSDKDDGIKDMGTDGPPEGDVAKQSNCAFSCVRNDINGWPVQRIAVAMQGPAKGAVIGQLWLHDDLTRAWYEMGGPVEMHPGCISTFDMISLLDVPTNKSPVEVYLQVDAKGAAPGRYSFAFAPDVSNPGT